MELTNEEKKEIGDAAADMMQAFSDFKLAENRLSIANELSGNLAKIKLPDGVMHSALAPYAAEFKKRQEAFFAVLGIQDSNTDFWDWYKKQPQSMNELKRRQENQ